MTSPIRKALQDADKIIAANAALEAASRPRGRSIRNGYQPREVARVLTDNRPADPALVDALRGAGVAKPARPLYIIARVARHDMSGNVPFGAVPYLQAMDSLSTLDDRFYDDNAVDIVTRFLGNVATWRGDTARAVKAELRAMLKAHKAAK